MIELYPEFWRYNKTVLTTKKPLGAIPTAFFRVFFIYYLNQNWKYMNGATSSDINSTTSWTVRRNIINLSTQFILIKSDCNTSAHCCGRKWHIIRIIIITHHSVLASKNWGICAGLKSRNIFSIISTDVAKSDARKNTHSNDTYTKVIDHPIKIVKKLSGMRLNTGRHALWMASPTPCIAPQNINFHAAPCQSPPISIVRKLFRYVRNTPLLFPPSGM